MLLRLNASVWPSGANAGSLSPTEFAGGEVSLRLSPDSTDSKNKPKGSLSEFLSATTSDFPSGVQANPVGQLVVGLISATLRSGGPSGETRYTEAFPPGLSRKNAMERPSGDQAGQESASG